MGDLEEAHRAHVRRRGRFVGGLLTRFEALDLSLALLRQRGFGSGVSWLDFKLGVRMLVRYPGLTALGGLAIAFAIFAGAGTFEFLRQVAHPTLPFEGGDRLVALQLWDAEEGDDRGQILFDYGIWQEELTTVEELGAFHTFERNLIVGEGQARLVTGAVMDAAGFRITGIEPLRGRILTEEDERLGAPLVVVLGHELWRIVFAGDPGILGSTVQVGTEAATVVGVMPEGFAFPVAHELWLPMRLDARAAEPAEGPSITVFGRLATGASLGDARAELTRVHQQIAAAFPATYEQARPFIRPYAGAMIGLPMGMSDGIFSLMAMAWNLPLVLFLILVCGNVALLMFARAAARESELVVRSALGAGRRRIIGQLFAEALVLALLGAALGLSVAGYGLRWGYHIVEIELWEGRLPFWFSPELSPSTVVYVLLLTVAGAAVAGVTPALKATRGLGHQLRRASAGGGGLRVGGVWTVVIVIQITLTVTFPVVAFAVGSEGREIQLFDLGIPAHEYLTAQVIVPAPEPSEDTDPDSAATPEAYRQHVGTTMADLEGRLLADPAVRGVTFAGHAPRMYTGWHQIEVDGPTVLPQDERGHRMGSVRVETDFFHTLGVQPRAGRDFRPADAESGSDGVIVNEAFVDYVLGGRNALGVLFRYVASERNRTQEEPGPWHRIVGVVQDLGAMSGYSSAVIYHPVVDGSLNPSYALVHVPEDAAGFAPRLRRIAFDVDPQLRIDDTLPLDRIVDSTVEFYRFWVFSLMMVSAVGVVLSLGGIYSVMSFTVARRTREIGVRVALGAPRSRILLSVFRRPLYQLAFGLLAGGLLTGFLLGFWGFDPTPLDATPREIASLLGYVALMAAICLAACVMPTRRALAIEPTEALSADG